MGLVGEVHSHLSPGGVLVGDGGFGSFFHPAVPAARGVHAAIRAHARPFVDFIPHRPHVGLGSKDVGSATTRNRPSFRG
jgi:hypothetical protein